MKSEPLLKLMSSLWREKALQCSRGPVRRQLWNEKLNKCFYQREPSHCFFIDHVWVGVMFWFPRAAVTAWQNIGVWKQQQFVCLSSGGGDRNHGLFSYVPCSAVSTQESCTPAERSIRKTFPFPFAFAICLWIPVSSYLWHIGNTPFELFSCRISSEDLSQTGKCLFRSAFESHRQSRALFQCWHRQKTVACSCGSKHG